jgi:hypothetical protein
VTGNVYHEYVRLLYEAYQAHESVDDYDLRSENLDSVTKWKTLLAEQRVASLALVNHVQSHAPSIIEIIERNYSS